MAEQKVSHTRASLYDIFYASKAKKTYTNLGVSLMLIIVFLIFALVPAISSIGDVQKKILSYENINNDLNIKYEAAKTLDRQYNTLSSESQDGLKEEIDFLNRVFMYKYDVKPVYANLYKRASESEVSILTIAPKFPNADEVNTATLDITKVPSVRTYEMDIAFRTNDMANVSKFLKSMEGYKEAPIFSRIETVSITDLNNTAKLNNADNPQNSTSTGISFSVTLVIYLDTSRFAENR
jgi:hypothetical protein